MNLLGPGYRHSGSSTSGSFTDQPDDGFGREALSAFLGRREICGCWMYRLPGVLGVCEGERWKNGESEREIMFVLLSFCCVVFLFEVMFGLLRLVCLCVCVSVCLCVCVSARL